MKTANSLKFGHARLTVISTLGSALALSACGINSKPHYPGEKSYGVHSDDSTPAQPSGKPIPHPTGSTTGGVTKAPAGNKPAGSSGNGGGVTPGGGDTTGTLDPSTLVLSRDYLANLNATGMAILTGDDGIKDNSHQLPKLIIAGVKEILKTRPDDNVQIQQNLGDGVQNSQLAQIVHVTPTSLGKIVDESADSGATTYDRVASDAGCPGMFICAKGAHVVTDSGSAWTYCYQDAGGSNVLLPVAIATNFTAADYQNHVGQYGPYVVTRYDGGQVDCAAPADATVLNTDMITLNVSLYGSEDGPRDGWTDRRYEVKNLLPVEYEVSLEYSRVDGTDDGVPYIDLTAGVQGQTRYLMNEQHQVLVKIMKTLRKPLLFVPETAGFWRSLLGETLETIQPVRGILINWSAELCRDELLPEDTGTYCN